MALLTLKEGGRTGELLIYDLIGENFFGDGITARAVQAELSLATKLEELTVSLNSIGGSVSDGNAIYNLLHRHPARIITDVVGVALSAASVIAMAGDEIKMASNALMMIHPAWGLTQGDAKDHEAQAGKLRKMTEAAADVYAKRTGNTLEQCVEWMEEETWFTAEEAKDKGFATHVLGAKTPPEAQNRARGAEFMKTFKHQPAQLRGLLGKPPLPPVSHGAPALMHGREQLRGLARLAGTRRRVGDV